jgi:steroid delta-isomerase-like uncharacterized protein
MFEEYLEAWNTRRGAAVGEFMDDTVDFEDVTMGVALKGRPQVEAFVAQLGETFSSDYHFTLVTELLTESFVGAEWIISWTHDPSSPDLAATGKPFTIRGATIARLQDGKITYNRDYWDMASFLAQVGALPG